MNKVILIGRLTRDPDVRYSQDGKNQTARFNLAVDRRFKQEGAQNTDFLPCVAFGKTAQFAETYLHQGEKVCVVGRIRTGSYTNREGQKVYTTDIVAEEIEFCESKKGTGAPQQSKQKAPDPMTDESGFMNIPDYELPFS